jgi:hypothetical protein
MGIRLKVLLLVLFVNFSNSSFAETCVSSQFIKKQERIMTNKANKLIPMIKHNTELTNNIRLYGGAFDDCRDNLGIIYKFATKISFEDWFCVKERKDWRYISKESLEYNKKMLDASIEVLKLRMELEALKNNICS